MFFTVCSHRCFLAQTAPLALDFSDILGSLGTFPSDSILLQAFPLFKWVPCTPNIAY